MRFSLKMFSIKPSKLPVIGKYCAKVPKQYAIPLTILIVILGLVFMWRLFISIETQRFVTKMQSSMGNAAVTVATAQAAKWSPTIPSTGTIMADQGVDVPAQASGAITKISFKSGQQVKKGDILVTQDSSVLDAELKSDMANLDLQKVNYQREKDLLAKKVASQSDLDTAKAEYDEALASVEQAKAQIALLTIRAPFDGKIGIRQVDLGQYLTAGNSIANLQATDPMYADFSLPEKYLSNLKTGMDVTVTTLATGDKVYKGKIIAFDSQLSETARSLVVRASLPNKEGALVPGMFADVTVILPDSRDVITVPQLAIQYSQYGDYVYIVDGDTATKTYVTVGKRRDETVSVLSGVKVGDVVVTTGQMNEINKVKVTIVKDAPDQTPAEPQ